MNKLEEIQKLKSLLDQGAITDEEFQSLKRKVLDSTFQQDSSAERAPIPYDNPANYIAGNNQGNSATPSVSNWQPPKKSKANNAAIIFASIAAVAVFLPWAELSGSVSGGGYNSSYSSGGMSGISIGLGVAGLVLTLIGGGLAIAGTKWAAIFGVFNVLDGIGYIFGWFNAQGNASFSSSYGGSSYHVEAGVHPQYGLFLFIIASGIFIIASLSGKSSN